MAKGAQSRPSRGSQQASQSDEGVSPPWTRLGLLFLGSGAAALIYEIIWFHLLRLVIGGAAVSLAIVLATFMGGMGLGSLLLPRLVSARRHPLKVYAGLELGIGLIGATLPWWFPWIGNLYLAHAEANSRDLLARSLVAGGCLLPATMLMGATLPAIARWVQANPEGLSRMGVFYGMNTLGAVLGCFIAGFLLLPQTDLTYASCVAAAINVIVGLMAWSMANSLPYTAALERADKPVAESSQPRGSRLVYVAVGLSGFAALSAEVIWTRLLALLYGATTYTFAIILMVFLAGIGIGSALAARIARHTGHPLRWLAACQLGLLPGLLWAHLSISHIVPYWHPNVSGEFYVYWVFLHDTMRTVVTVFLPALLWGASFSFGLAAMGHGQPDTGRLVGRIYAANTCGAILGALATSLWLVPALGSQRVEQLLMLVAGLAAMLALVAETRARSAGEVEPGSESSKPRWLELPWLGSTRSRWAVGGCVALAILALRPLPHGLLGNSIMPHAWKDFTHDFEKESQNTAVVVLNERSTGFRSLCVSGKVEASTNPDDLRCQRLLGHVAALVHPNPQSTLTVGLGAGTTAGCFVLYPSVKRIRVCEIEPAIVEAAGGYFAEANHHVVTDPRTEITIDDARHFMAVTDEKFDIITSDPIHPWVRGSAVLYSREYYELCRKRLNPGGVYVQWIPLYQTDMMTVSCELATFLSVFPNATLWSSGADRSRGYDIIAVGQTEPAPLDLEKLEKRIQGNPRLQAALDEVRMGSVLKLFNHYVGRGSDLGEVLADAEINQESSLKLEYMAGMASLFQEPDAILRLILEPLRYPADWLVNDERFRGPLHAVLGLPLPESEQSASN